MDHIFGEDWAGANAKLYGDPEYFKNIHLVKGPKDENGYFNKMHNFDESRIPKVKVETNRGGIPTPKPIFTQREATTSIPTWTISRIFTTQRNSIQWCTIARLARSIK